MKKRDSLKNIKFAFILNIVFSFIELIGGILTNSISIISDSIHDFGDAMAIFISVLLEKKSRKNPDKNYTFGYLRYSVLGAFITSTILLIGSFIVIYNAVLRLFSPEMVNYNGMIIFAILGFCMNLFAAYKTSDSNNLNEKAINLHMIEDVLGWFVVLIGSIVMKIFNLSIIDPILSICIALFILFNVVKNYIKIGNIFLEKVPNGVDIDKIKKILLNDKIKDIHHVHIWSMDGVNNYATFHVLLDKHVKLEEVEDIKIEIKDKLKYIKINHSVIEFEIKDCFNKECNTFIEIDSHGHSHHH